MRHLPPSVTRAPMMRRHYQHDLTTSPKAIINPARRIRLARGALVINAPRPRLFPLASRSCLLQGREVRFAAREHRYGLRQHDLARASVTRERPAYMDT